MLRPQPFTRACTTTPGQVLISTGMEGLWERDFPVTQQLLPSQLLGSKLCNAAHTAVCCV